MWQGERAMSTRTNIHFVDAPNADGPNIYRHCDGYPSGVLGDMERFFADVAKLDDTCFGDPEYLASKFVVWQAAEYARGDSPLNFLSVGISFRDHGDIEYVYEVVCDRGWSSTEPPRVRWHACDGNWHEWSVGDEIPV